MERRFRIVTLVGVVALAWAAANDDPRSAASTGVGQSAAPDQVGVISGAAAVRRDGHLRRSGSGPGTALPLSLSLESPVSLAPLVLPRGLIWPDLASPGTLPRPRAERSGPSDPGSRSPRTSRGPPRPA